MAECAYDQSETQPLRRRRAYFVSSAEAEESQQPTDEPTANKGTILLVDDDPAILKVLADLLAGDLRVITADSGERALEQSRSFSGQIHLLLTDITMPKMNGIDLATQITAQRPEIKVVLMSGFNGDIHLPNQGWHYISKPFKPSQLITLVKALLSLPDSKSTAA
jgi:two-component system cell cycle sensor histidine kinase/response regulator CckA